jgi:hypothetical protein
MTQIRSCACNGKAIDRACAALYFASPDSELTSSSVAVLLLIARRIGPYTGYTYLTYDIIELEAWLPPGTGADVVHHLVALGFLGRNAGVHPGSQSRYWLGPNVPGFTERDAE